MQEFLLHSSRIQNEAVSVPAVEQVRRELSCLATDVSAAGTRCTHALCTPAVTQAASGTPQLNGASGDAGRDVPLVTLLRHALRVHGPEIAHTANVCIKQDGNGVSGERGEQLRMQRWRHVHNIQER